MPSKLQWVLGIAVAAVDRVTVTFHPLHEFQVVKRASFHKFADLNVLHPLMLSIKIYDTKWIKRQQSSVCYHTHNGIFRKSVGSSLEFWISLDPSTKQSWSEKMKYLGNLKLVEDILKHLVVLDHVILCVCSKTHLQNKAMRNKNSNPTICA